MKDLFFTKKSFWLSRVTIYIIFFLSLLALNIPAALFTKHLNVYDIFRNSFHHLIHHQDLYAPYPNEYFDQYLYSPSFSILFSPFAVLPYYVGYFLWNNLSMLLVPFLVFKIKGLSENKKAIVCYIALIEMLTCLQGSQTNVMIAALMILAFLSFENKNYWLAAFAIAIGFYIKIYPIVAASLFILYPRKLKFIWKFALAMIVVGLLPLLLISPSELVVLYRNWAAALVVDQTDNYGKISLTGLFQVWFNITDFQKLIVQIAGVLLFCTMYIKYNSYKVFYYRLSFLCVLLIWVALFNHASEIYGYAISIWGVGLWYAMQPSSKKLNIFIGLFVLFATVLSIDPTPRCISKYIYEHALKVIPYTIMCGYIIYTMLKGSFSKPNDVEYTKFESF